MTFYILVRLKSHIPDASSESRLHDLHTMGFLEVLTYTGYKYIQLDCTKGTTRKMVEAMCQQFLANPVIESYQVLTAPPVARPRKKRSTSPRKPTP